MLHLTTTWSIVSIHESTIHYLIHHNLFIKNVIDWSFEYNVSFHLSALLSAVFRTVGNTYGFRTQEVLALWKPCVDTLSAKIPRLQSWDSDPGH